MDFAIAIILHTPPWVFAVLAYLVWIGVKGLQPRALPLARVFVTPGVFILWGLWGAASRHLPPVVTAAAWFISRAAPFPLLRNLTFFCLRYGLGVATAVSHGDGRGLALIATAVSGLSAGYFLGWIAMFRRTLSRAPTATPGFTTDLAVQAPLS